MQERTGRGYKKNRIYPSDNVNVILKSFAVWYRSEKMNITINFLFYPMLKK